MLRKLLIALVCLTAPMCAWAQINTDRVMTIARNALYFEDYVLSIQYFNQVIDAKPYLFEPYFFRGLAKMSLEDFHGAEADCDLAIQRNPFVVGAYQVRGLARIRQNNYDGAIEDYRTALKYDPENLVLWHNLSLCHIQKKDYSEAMDDLNRLLKVAPRYASAYLMRGEVNLNQKDTVQALNDFNKAIELERYEPDGWNARAIVSLQQGKYKEAEDDLNQAIHLSVKNASLYINRALARFHQNNLRGAMSDYDLALDIDPNNFIGHYNRGLLRARVGDDNRAIEDFDFVLKVDPDDMMATFNRGVLRAQTGDYRGAIRDYSRVLAVYPNFMAGYYQRAEARKKIGDAKGAEQDEFVIMKAQLDQLNGNAKKDSDAERKNAEVAAETRKKSDKNVENYHKIVIADDSEVVRHYTNDSRGRVQDRTVKVKPEPLFVLSYYSKDSKLKHSAHFHHDIDALNHTKALPKALLITNAEAPLDEEQVRLHFAQIDAHTADVVADKDNALKWFARGMDFYLVQDFDNAIDDWTKSILLNDGFFPAYYMRALVRFKQLEYKKAEAELNEQPLLTQEESRDKVTNMDYDLVRTDLDKVVQLAPDFAYGYYNRAYVLSALKDYRAAVNDYTKAIDLDPTFAEAYYNRGITNIFLGNNKQGIADLSKAGELGIVSAYNVIKRYADK